MRMKKRNPLGGGHDVCRCRDLIQSLFLRLGRYN